MTLASTNIIDLIQVNEQGIIHVREAEVINKDGVEVARNFHRSVFTPGQDVSSQPEKIKAIANATWTTEVVSAYEAMVASQARGV